MAPSNILRSSLLLSSTVGRTATTRITTAFPSQTRYATAINASRSRRSIWTFLSGDKPQDQAAKNGQNAENHVEEQAEFEEQSSPLEAQQEQDAQTLSSTSATPIIDQVKEVESELLPEQEVQQQQESNWLSTLPPPSLRQHPYTLKRGTVTSVGLMSKTVRVAYQHREWDRKIRKYYPKTTTYLVHDPRNSLREGDVIEFSSGAPRAPRVRHVVERIISPFGSGVEERPAVLTREEREAEMAQKRMVKLIRKGGKVAEQEGKDVEQVTRRVVESKEHIGRIRGLVIERAAIAAQTQARA